MNLKQDIKKERSREYLMKKHDSEGGKKSEMRSTMWASAKGTEGTWKIRASTKIDGVRFSLRD